MTTDPFTEAARAEAERQFPEPLYSTAWSQNEVQIKRALWESGAAWASDHLAAQEPTDKECIAILNAVTTPFGEKVQNHEWAYAGIQRCREAIMDARRKEYK